MPELIGIMDTCFCCLITWLEGHSLAQTVFTCLYIHNPDFIEDPAMKAFALGILKICDIAREKVNKAAVFEEVRFYKITILEAHWPPYSLGVYVILWFTSLSTWIVKSCPTNCLLLYKDWFVRPSLIVLFIVFKIWHCSQENIPQYPSPGNSIKGATWSRIKDCAFGTPVSHAGGPEFKSHFYSEFQLLLMSTLEAVAVAHVAVGLLPLWET